MYSIEDLTVGEFAQLEKHEGITVSDLAGGVSIRTLAYAMWLFMRRADSTLPLDPAPEQLDAMPVADLLSGSDDPTQTS